MRDRDRVASQMPQPHVEHHRQRRQPGHRDHPHGRHRLRSREPLPQHRHTRQARRCEEETALRSSLSEIFRTYAPDSPARPSRSPAKRPAGVLTVSSWTFANGPLRRGGELQARSRNDTARRLRQVAARAEAANAARKRESARRLAVLLTVAAASVVVVTADGRRVPAPRRPGRHRDRAERPAKHDGDDNRDGDRPSPPGPCQAPTTAQPVASSPLTLTAARSRILPRQGHRLRRPDQAPDLAPVRRPQSLSARFARNQARREAPTRPRAAPSKSPGRLARISSATSTTSPCPGPSSSPRAASPSTAAASPTPSHGCVHLTDENAHYYNQHLPDGAEVVVF